MAADILVVEDERAIADAVAARSAQRGLRVDDRRRRPRRASSAAGADRPDLVVLDLMLPGIDGLEVCRRIQRDRPVPVLMLTARDDETDLLVGLARRRRRLPHQAVQHRELVARVQAAPAPGRRGDRAPSDGRVRLGDVVDRRSHAGGCARGDEPVHLTPTEFDLLACLARRPGVVCTREQLLAEVWGYRDGSGAAPSTPTCGRCAASSATT